MVWANSPCGGDRTDFRLWTIALIPYALSEKNRYLVSDLTSSLSVRCLMLKAVPPSQLMSDFSSLVFSKTTLLTPISPCRKKYDVLL